MNGTVRIQKVGDVMLYAYVQSLDGSPPKIGDVTLYIGGQEIDTWDLNYLTVVHPGILDERSNYILGSSFIPLPPRRA